MKRNGLFPDPAPIKMDQEEIGEKFGMVRVSRFSLSLLHFVDYRFQRYWQIYLSDKE